MRKLAARIIFFVLMVFVVTSCFNQAMYAYSLPVSNYMIEWDDADPLIWENETELEGDCDVAQVAWTFTNAKIVNLKIDNAYPGYQSTITTNIKNTGSMPVKLDAINVDFPDENRNLLNISFLATDGMALNQRVLEKNESIEVKLGVEVAKHVEQNQNFLFRIIISAVQGTGENGGNGGENGGNNGGGSDPGGNPGGSTGENTGGTIDTNIEPEEPNVKPELPEVIIEQNVMPEPPQVGLEQPELPIKYNELPRTGGNQYALMGAVIAMAGIGILLRKRVL